MLAIPIYWYDNVGRRVPSEHHRIRLRRDCWVDAKGYWDLADALALTFALPVAKKQPEDIYIKRRKEITQKTDYDPSKSSNFRRIAEGLDVKPLLQLLDAKPELWKEIEARQKFTNSPHEY